MNSAKTVYADFAAATPIDPRVIEAMQPYFSDAFYNPSSIYLASIQVAKDIESARDKVAKLISAKPAEVLFTAGATESCNLAIRGIMDRYPDANMIVSDVEHHAVSHTAQQYDAKSVWAHEPNKLLEEVSSAIDDRTVLVSIMYANNETGAVCKLQKISEIINQERQKRAQSGSKLPIYFHTDASQAPNYLHLEVNRLGIDLMTLNAAKVYGPKQVGALYVRTGLELNPLITGGGQELGYRSGTENAAGIIGFARALEIASAMRAKESERLKELSDFFVSSLQDVFSSILVNSNSKNRLPNITNVSFSGLDGERMVMELDELGVMCSTGSACSANIGGGSDVLKAMGRSKAEIDSSLRFSFGRSTKKSDVEHIIISLKQVVQKLQDMEHA